jgi:hypothetical protein
VHETLSFQLLADVVLSLHVAFVAFVVGGLVLIIAGNLLVWRWVDAMWFRLAHLAAVATVVAESWSGVLCPLTSLEFSLREQAHETTYIGSFIEHWLQRILYFEAPAWVFTITYSLFGLVVAVTWWYFPPRRNQRSNETEA